VEGVGKAEWTGAGEARGMGPMGPLTGWGGGWVAGGMGF
jgi:hypothetical protein